MKLYIVCLHATYNYRLEKKLWYYNELKDIYVSI